MKTVLVSERLSEACAAALAKRGFIVRRMPPDPRLPEPVNDHADLLTAHLPTGELLVTESYARMAARFCATLPVPLRLTDESLGDRYPQDVLLDALAVGDRLYGKREAVSVVLRSCYRTFMALKQGYARCSVALLSDTCAVTADHGLAEALRRDGVEVLEIRAGHIRLPGYDSGFIGGAGGALGGGTYAFFGNLLSHPDGERIAVFAESKKINAVSLTDEPLSDRGGLLVLQNSSTVSSDAAISTPSASNRASSSK